MNQHPVPMTRQGLVPALGRGQVQELARYKLPLRRERQLEGIAKAKAAGVYKGRQASINAAQVRQMKAQGLGATAIANELGIGRASVYRGLEGDSI
jgi:DNA invertase Pin-like site-specific DNA recombinase